MIKPTDAMPALPGSRPAGPSRLYQAKLWELGLRASRIFPARLLHGLGSLIATLYAGQGNRKRVVLENLLPVFDGEERPARQAASRLFRQFARKLVDLWRYESGISVDENFVSGGGWDHFEAARKTGRGILLVTPHLGNWEFGAPLLARHQIPLLVITLSEPDPRLTAMRQASRARRGIETLVIGDNPFAFVEIIRRLEAGACVALLVDRPPAASSIGVTLFGRPFRASVAAAELARASGCLIVPVFLPRDTAGYAAQMLPPIEYERPGLRSPAARLDLTQRTLSVFEGPIRQYADQWYHFVPVWNAPEKT